MAEIDSLGEPTGHAGLEDSIPEHPLFRMVKAMEDRIPEAKLGAHFQDLPQNTAMLFLLP